MGGRRDVTRRLGRSITQTQGRRGSRAGGGRATLFTCSDRSVVRQTREFPMREKMQRVYGGLNAGGRSVTSSAHAESLEPRRLLAGIESGILVARGTEGADTISTRRTGTDDVIVTTNGVSQTFDMDNFTGVRLEGLGGNDTFNLIDPLVSPQVENTTVLGGAGDDTISYATRTASLRVSIDPAGSQMTSGAQVDSFDDVETVIGGSGADSFG